MTTNTNTNAANTATENATNPNAVTTANPTPFALPSIAAATAAVAAANGKGLSTPEGKAALYIAYGYLVARESLRIQGDMEGFAASTAALQDALDVLDILCDRTIGTMDMETVIRKAARIVEDKDNGGAWTSKLSQHTLRKVVRDYKGITAVVAPNPKAPATPKPKKLTKEQERVRAMTDEERDAWAAKKIARIQAELEAAKRGEVYITPNLI